jgi:hypothetical protein
MDHSSQIIQLDMLKDTPKARAQNKHQINANNERWQVFTLICTSAGLGRMIA